MALTFGDFTKALDFTKLNLLITKAVDYAMECGPPLSEEESAVFKAVDSAIVALTENEALIRGIEIIKVLELPDETLFDPSSEEIWTKAWNSVPEEIRAPMKIEDVVVTQTEIEEHFPKGLSFGDFGNQMEGISLSLSADMMLFGTGKSAADFLKETVGKIKANEAKIRGVTEEEFLNSPSETQLDPTTVKIWVMACNTLDKVNQE